MTAQTVSFKTYLDGLAARHAQEDQATRVWATLAATPYLQDLSPCSASSPYVSEALHVKVRTSRHDSAQQERTRTALAPSLAFRVRQASLHTQQATLSAQTVLLVTSKTNQRKLSASKSNLDKSSLTVAAPPSLSHLDLKSAALILPASATSALHSKRARRGPKVKIHRRDSASRVRLGSRAPRQPRRASPATRESSALTAEDLAKSAWQVTSKIRTPTQANRVKNVRQDGARATRDSLCASASTGRQLTSARITST